MFKLLVGAALGFAAAWFMDTQEGAQRRTLVKDKATGVAGKGKEQATQAVNQVKAKASSGGDAGGDGGDSYQSATSAEPIVEADPQSAPGTETFRQS